MKGLELSRAFFEKAGRPIIEKVSPGILNSITAGLIGEGSDVYGFDDEISTDHNWGPRFQIFLFEQNPDLQESIEKALSNYLQKKFEDKEIKQWPPGEGYKPFEVWFWPDFTEKLVGLRRRPIDPVSYARVTESQFFSLLSGTIFWDPNDDLKRAQAQWDHMPQEVWHWKLHWACMNLYRRDDILRAFIHKETEMSKILLCRYAEWATRLGYLVAREYSPYRKWLLRVFKTLTGMDKVYNLIAMAINSQDVIAGYENLEHAISILRDMMVDKKYLPENIGGLSRDDEPIQKPIKSRFDENFDAIENLSTNDQFETLDQEGKNLLEVELERAMWIYKHNKARIDVYPIAEYFLSLIGSGFRDQATRLCPLDLVGLLEQRPKNAP